MQNNSEITTTEFNELLEKFVHEYSNMVELSIVNAIAMYISAMEIVEKFAKNRKKINKKKVVNYLLTEYLRTELPDTDNNRRIILLVEEVGDELIELVMLIAKNGIKINTESLKKIMTRYCCCK
jgi:hypothetical protein